MKDVLKIWSVLCAFVVAIVVSSCTDEREFSTDPSHRLAFSCDTVAFDTLFTDVSSATQILLIYNRNKEDLAERVRDFVESFDVECHAASWHLILYISSSQLYY